MIALYHFLHDAHSQRVRLALQYKGVAFEDHALAYDDDETFFELGLARQVPILMIDDQQHTDSVDILWRIDELFPDTPPLKNQLIDEDAWQALLEWRAKVDQVFARLYAPVAPAYHGIGDNAEALQAYKAEVQAKYGMSIEELANDRYDGYKQLSSLSHLNALSKHLSQTRFYMGQMSIADILLLADIYPVQVLDGISLPIDMMYYLKRVEDACGIAMNDALLTT